MLNDKPAPKSGAEEPTSESRAEPGWHLERLEVFRYKAQADTAYLGDETSLPRGLR